MSGYRTELLCVFFFVVLFFQAEDGIRDLVRSRGLGDVYKRQGLFAELERRFLAERLPRYMAAADRRPDRQLASAGRYDRHATALSLIHI